MMHNFKKSDYEYWGQWKQPVLSTWFWLEWHKTPSLKEINTNNIKLNPLIYLDGHFWIEKNNRLAILKGIKQTFAQGKTKGYLETVTSTFQKYEREYLEVLSLPTANPDEYVSKLFIASKNMAAIWTWIMFVTDDVSKIVLEEKTATSEAELLERVHKITPQTWLEKQNAEVNGFAQACKSLNMAEVNSHILDKHPELKSKIEAHVKEFAWFGSHHWMGKGYNIDQCLAQINEALKSSKEYQLKTMSESDEHPAVKLIAAGTYWRTHSAEVTAKVVFASRPILENLGKFADLTYDELIYLSGPEVLALNENSDKKSLQAVIHTRMNNGYGCIVNKNNIELITGADLKMLMSQLLTINTKQVNEFKGSIASKGPIVKGIARVIISPDDFHKLKEGEILVAPETTPDFVPLMKRSSAIITDVGGITSHAAIVSRELKKPCIIGTKIATQMIQDGDMIEVDTDKGIIKILK
jgi:phosphohistidine swiveling domain-containing protein